MYIRPFCPADTPALTRLLHAAYAELGAQGLNFTAVDQDEATTLARASKGRCWVMEDRAGRLAATLALSYPPTEALQALSTEARKPRRIWLNQLAVSPACRGQGLAYRLIALALTVAREMGTDSIGLDTALPAKHLLALYRGWGFVACEVIHWPGKTYDSAVMIRPL